MFVLVLLSLSIFDRLLSGLFRARGLETGIKWTHKELVGLQVEKDETLKHPTEPGLRLRAYVSGYKAWQWARMLEGKALRKKLGRFPAVSLSEAQVLATELNDAFEHRQVSPLKPA